MLASLETLKNHVTRFQKINLQFEGATIRAVLGESGDM